MRFPSLSFSRLFLNLPLRFFTRGFSWHSWWMMTLSSRSRISISRSASSCSRRRSSSSWFFCWSAARVSSSSQVRSSCRRVEPSERRVGTHGNPERIPPYFQSPGAQQLAGTWPDHPEGWGKAGSDSHSEDTTRVAKAIDQALETVPSCSLIIKIACYWEKMGVWVEKNMITYLNFTDLVLFSFLPLYKGSF